MSIRAALSRHRCTIYVAADLVDDTGGVVRDPLRAIRVDVPCLLQEAGGDSGERHGRAAQWTGARIRIIGDYDLTLDRTHAVEIGGRIFRVASAKRLYGIGPGEMVYTAEEIVA